MEPDKDPGRNQRDEEKEKVEVKEIEDWISSSTRINEVLRRMDQNFDDINKSIKKIACGDDLTLDSKTLLQIDATTIVGALFFLTLTSYLQSYSTMFINVWMGMFTTIIVIPFAASAMLLLLPGPNQPAAIPKKVSKLRLKLARPFVYDKLKSARYLTYGGFLYLAGLLVSIVFANVIPVPVGLESVEENCAKNPELYNVSHLWKCSEFKAGSLADRCATDPSRFGMEKTECSKFIPPSA